MKSIKFRLLLTCVFVLLFSSVLSATEFKITLTITNKSNEYQKLFLKKGRILEIAKIDATDYQSIIITEGDGLIIIPPRTTITRVVKGICLHKGLKFPDKKAKIQFTPFIGSDELVSANNNQKKIHNIVSYPKRSRVTLIGKGYSDEKKNGKAKDREEAIANAIQDAARQSGVTYESEAIMDNFRLVKDFKRIEIGSRTVYLKKTIHEEYDTKKGEYLFIGEFEVEYDAPSPEVY